MDFYNYELMEKEEGRFLVKVTYNEAHDVFKGHFPSRAVVPGVMLMQTVRECFEDLTGNTTSIETGDLKFMNPVVPGTENAIHIEINYSLKDDGNYKIKSSGFSGETKFFKINISGRPN